MKKILLTLLLATSLIACEKEEAPQPASPKTNTKPVATEHIISIEGPMLNGLQVYSTKTVNGQPKDSYTASNGLPSWKLKTGDYIYFKFEYGYLYSANGDTPLQGDLSLTVYDNNIMVYKESCYCHWIAYAYKVP